jgi:hypothetical protein
MQARGDYCTRPFRNKADDQNFSPSVTPMPSRTTRTSVGSPAFAADLAQVAAVAGRAYDRDHDEAAIAHQAVLPPGLWERLAH